MNEILQKIRQDISNGYTNKALKRAISLAKEKSYKNQLNSLSILSSQFQKHQREYLEGETTDRITQNRIDLAILSIIDSIERLNEPISVRNNENYISQIKGEVIYINYDKRFGFLKSSDLKNHIFFHFSSSKNDLKIKQKVIFHLKKNSKGWYASLVEIDTSFKSHFLRNSKSKKPNFLFDSKKLIAIGKTKKAIDLIIKNIDSNDSNINKFIGISNRLYKLTEKEIEGTIPTQDYLIEFNKLNSSLLKLIDMIKP